MDSLELKAGGDVPLLDRTLDVDGHEFAPNHLWGEVFGPAAGRMAPLCAPFVKMMGEDYMFLPHLAGDDMPMTLENVWTVRTTGAPGAFDMRRRLEALDLMGVRRQLIFPSFALFAQMLAAGAEGGGAVSQAMRDLLGAGVTPEEALALGAAGIDEYNDWAVCATALAPDRLRPVGILRRSETADALVAQARNLLDRGLRALLVDTGAPMAPCSPAALAMDPFWALMSERNVPVLAHVGGDGGFLRAPDWSAAEAFAPTRQGLEFGLEPYSFSTLHLSIEHYLSVLVMGGVFERHPRLRFGAIELGSHWLGPLAENLDMWATTLFAKRMASIISMKPSDYIARNIRVTPHNTVEPVADYLRRYPHLADCYCYSTDYPHVEGGRNIKTRVYEMLAPLGEEALEKYFARNGEWLLPP